MIIAKITLHEPVVNDGDNTNNVIINYTNNNYDSFGNIGIHKLCTNIKIDNVKRLITFDSCGLYVILYADVIKFTNFDKVKHLITIK